MESKNPVYTGMRETVLEWRLVMCKLDRLMLNSVSGNER